MDRDGVTPETIRVRLDYRPPIDVERIFRFLGVRAIPGVEEVSGSVYRRTLTLPHGVGLVALWAGDPGAIECELQLEDPKDLTPAVQRCRRLLDLDADPATVSAFLERSELLRPLVRACPGRRVPGHVDGAELALRAVLGQQVSVAAARTLGARLTAAYGKPLGAMSGPGWGLTHCFPAADTIAGVDPDTLPMPRARGRALVGLAAALASEAVRLDPGASWDEAGRQLLALPGIGPWTVGYIRMRALADPDAFLPTDVGVRHGLAALGAGSDPKAAERLAESWRPWRSYALQHLWAHIEETP